MPHRQGMTLIFAVPPKIYYSGFAHNKSHMTRLALIAPPKILKGYANQFLLKRRIIRVGYYDGSHDIPC
jgi:hypothetical protein